jgi:hypothetical protein
MLRKLAGFRFATAPFASLRSVSLALRELAGFRFALGMIMALQVKGSISRAQKAEKEGGGHEGGLKRSDLRNSQSRRLQYQVTI